MILAVTGFVPIPGHPRPPEAYHELGNKLRAIKSPICVAEGELLQHCWLHKWIQTVGDRFTHSTADNPRKNSMAYHVVQAQKTAWLAEVANADSSPDVLVWIDYGIFHLPGVTVGIIDDFLKRAETERAIAIPGCWNRNYAYDDKYPCWRFCGGVIIVPRAFAGVLDVVMKEEYKRHLKATRNLSWEVNALARVEQRYPELPIRHYRADHDASMFLNYRGEACQQ
jgi:hypothetical protein